MWESIKSFWGDITSGYSYGDLAQSTIDARDAIGLQDSSSWGFKIGDYAEDVVGFIAKGAKNVAKNFASNYVESQFGGGRMPDRKPTFVRSGAGSTYQTTGKYRASQVNYNEVGYADPRVQQAARQLAGTNNASFQAAFNPIGMTVRQGTPTMSIDMTPGINVRTQTKPVEIA